MPSPVLQTHAAQCPGTFQRQAGQLSVGGGGLSSKYQASLVGCLVGVLERVKFERAARGYDGPPSRGTCMGNGVMLEPSESVTLATPSFSTSSMRMTACMGMKLRCTPSNSFLELVFAWIHHQLRFAAEDVVLHLDEAVEIALIDVVRVDLVDLALIVENHFVDVLRLLGVGHVLSVPEGK